MNIQRIVSLAPSNTEIVFVLDAQDKLVGVTEFCNYPPEVKLINKIGGFSTPDIKKIIFLSPDLVLATDFHAQTIIPKLKAENITVYVAEARTVLDVPKAITAIGRLLGCKEKALKLAVKIEKEIGAIRHKVKVLIHKPKVCYICSNNPLRVGRDKCCVEPFIEIAGGLNIGAEILKDKTIDLSAIADKNPDVIIVGTGHGETVDLMEYVKNESILYGTNAYQNNRVYRVEADLLRLGPRVVNGLKKFAGFIHPEIFGEE